MNFDEINKRWFFPALIAKAKGHDAVSPNVVKPAHGEFEKPGPSVNKNVLPSSSETRVGLHISKGVLMINHHDLPENTHLGKISMLGSHDAGTYDFSGFKSAGAVFPFAFKTQSLNLKEQAIAGARYFDVRVAEKADGSFGFFHGTSVTGGDAVADVRDLLGYAKEDSKNFYIFKFAFKNDKTKNIATTTSSDKFLRQALEGYYDNMITQKDTPALSMAKVTLLNEHKNLAVMVHHYRGSEPHWRYEQQVYTKWANHANAKKTADFIVTFHSAPAPKDKLTLIQTNMPYASIKNREITLGVGKNLDKNTDVIASAVDEILFPGIICGDYIGTSIGASERFRIKINSDNHKLLTSSQP